jgi:hypothetical protein
MPKSFLAFMTPGGATLAVAASSRAIAGRLVQSAPGSRPDDRHRTDCQVYGVVLDLVIKKSTKGDGNRD